MEFGAALWNEIHHVILSVHSAFSSPEGVLEGVLAEGAREYDEHYGTAKYESSTRADSDTIRGLRIRFAGVPVVTFRTAEALLQPYAPLFEHLASLPSHKGYFNGDAMRARATPEARRMLVPQPGASELLHPLPIGYIVAARWGGGQWLGAHITSVLEAEGLDGDGEDGDGDGACIYSVAFCDGELEHGLAAASLRVPSPVEVLAVRTSLAMLHGNENLAAKLQNELEKADKSAEGQRRRAEKRQRKQKADAAAKAARHLEDNALAARATCDLRAIFAVPP